mmetsp:Transcript_3053/g.3225  ORF Transcript_3053/g.3225 Transcript_3053/m.3225 type:complete len:217 (+) Transcript_3053:101-751(+)
MEDVKLIVTTSESMLDSEPENTIDSDDRENFLQKVKELTANVKVVNEQANIIEEEMKKMKSKSYEIENSSDRSNLKSTRKSNKITSTIESQQILLLNKIFSDDENPNDIYFVAEVKYYDEYQQVCCFCIPYKGDIEAAKVSAEDFIQSNAYNEDLIFDCTYVKKQVDEYDKSKSMDPNSSLNRLSDSPENKKKGKRGRPSKTLSEEKGHRNKQKLK